jgi:hypothetical protein
MPATPRNSVSRTPGISMSPTTRYESANGTHQRSHDDHPSKTSKQTTGIPAVSRPARDQPTIWQVQYGLMCTLCRPASPFTRKRCMENHLLGYGAGVRRAHRAGQRTAPGPGTVDGGPAAGSTSVYSFRIGDGSADRRMQILTREGYLGQPQQMAICWSVPYQMWTA